MTFDNSNAEDRRAINRWKQDAENLAVDLERLTAVGRNPLSDEDAMAHIRAMANRARNAADNIPYFDDAWAPTGDTDGSGSFGSTSVPREDDTGVTKDEAFGNTSQDDPNSGGLESENDSPTQAEVNKNEDGAGEVDNQPQYR